MKNLNGLIQDTSQAHLYLDLLAKSLTNTLYEPEPDMNEKNEPLIIGKFLRHYINNDRAITMLPIARLNNLRSCIVDVIEQNIPGDLIETGVWRGGGTIFMRAVFKAYGVSDRKVWVADSFEGLPEPDPQKRPREALSHQGAVMKKAYKHFAVGLEDVKRNFHAYGLLDEQVKFLKGWFKDTLPTAPIGALAVMRLDGDYYESTWDALTHLYDRLAVGGYVIVDDYGEDTWTYCRKAVDEFRYKRGITESMISVDSKCYFWRKTSLGKA